MDKAITSALLVIASITAALALFNAVMPAVGKSSGALTAANSDAADRIRTDIEIVHAVGDTGADEVTVWVKNVGTKKIQEIDASDIIITTPSEVKRISYDASCSAPECWSYSIENGSDWEQGVTVKFTVKLNAVTAGSYNVIVSVYNGVSAEADFSV